MEDHNETILLDVDLSAYIKSLQEMQVQYKKTKDLIDELTKADGDNSAEIAQLTQQNKVLAQEMKGVEKQMQNEIKQHKAAEGSLVQLRAQLANLNKQYDSMSGFDRMGVAGQELQTKIKGLSDQIINLEGSTGRWQRNVGNYKSALEGLKTGFQGAGLATGGLDKSLKLLNANPIVLTLTAIVTVVKDIIKAFKDNEAATMNLKEAFSAFNPIVDKVKRGVEAFAMLVVNVVSKAVNGLTQALGWLLQKAQDVANFFGADAHFADNFREGAQDARELAAAENDYIMKKRKWSVESAKIDRDVAELREKAADKERYNAQERLKFMDDAIALETKKAATEKQLAEQNLDNLRKEAERSANSAAMNDKLAEAERAVIEADKNLADTKRSLNKQRQQAVNEINGETAAIVKQTQAIRDQLETIKAYAIDQALEEAAKKNKELADNITKVADRVGLFQEQFDKLDPHALDGLFGEVTDENLTDTTTQWELFAESFKANAKDIEAIASSLGSSFSSLSSMYAQMAKDESKSEAERAKAAKQAKAWAGMQIAANSGTALAKGIAGAMDAPTVVGKIAALASIMAAVLSAVSQARQLAQQTYETGGVIGGYHGASMGSDNTAISARRGEMVINADQQRRLFEIANGTANSSLTASLVTALQSMPAPVLVYSELQEFGNTVKIIDNNAKLS